MYRLTLIIAIVFGIMSFAFSEKGMNNEAYSKTEGINSTAESASTLVAESDQKGKKGGAKNQKGPKSKGSKGRNKSKKVFSGAKPKRGGNKGKNQSRKSKKVQSRKGVGKAKNQKSKGKSTKLKHANGRYKKAVKGKNGKLVYTKGHPNFRYVYVNNHGVYSHKNFGQWRSQQARNKHKNYRPFYEYEAIAGFNLIIGRNTFLYSETEYKINLVNVRLEEKRAAGGISLVQYNAYQNRIQVLQKRRASLQIDISL